MFGAKYSRLKFWVISLILFVIFAVITSFGRFYADSGEYDIAIKYNIASIVLSLMWINTLANRIRDYGSNPWISVLSLIPLVNIGLALYYGIIKYIKRPEDKHKNINVSNSSLTKAVLNHAKEVASELKPKVESYKQSHARADSVDEVQNIITEADIDDEVYEQAMIEIDEDKKVKATWARALSQADGDKDKAEALYIQFRVKAIPAEAEKAYQIKCEEENKEKEKKLQLFIEEYGIQIDRKISETKYLTSNGSITWFEGPKYWRFY